VETGYFDTYPGSDTDSFSGCWGVYPFAPSGNIYISDRDSGLYVVAFDSTAVGIGDRPEENILPRGFSLDQNHPNPFNPSTTITYTIPEGDAVNVRMRIFDLRGRLVRTLIEGTRGPGRHSVQWDGRDDRGEMVGSSLYVYRLDAEGFSSTKKMAILR
jgi:hypothetical protein